MHGVWRQVRKLRYLIWLAIALAIFVGLTIPPITVVAMLCAGGFSVVYTGMSADITVWNPNDRIGYLEEAVVASIVMLAMSTLLFGVSLLEFWPTDDKIATVIFWCYIISATFIVGALIFAYDQLWKAKEK